MPLSHPSHPLYSPTKRLTDTKMVLVSVNLLFLAGLYLYAETAFAKTVSVKDIIRPNKENVAETISTESIPMEIARGVKKYSYASNPLFLAKTTLNNEPETITANLNPAALYTWAQNLLKPHTKNAEDAYMNLVDNRVTDFNPGQNGFYPDTHATTVALMHNLRTGIVDTTVVALSVSPSFGLDKTNTLGINTFLSGGLSDFSGSSKNRKANIEAGSKKVRGVLVSAGETFSFNQYLGDVTAEDGFKPEIVIKADGLKPELGGGICQVSSTLFRAVVQSGMPVATRRNHAFSVNHYFPPGTDATVYSPYTDFKFINDTPATVLIWTYYKDDHTLAFDLYGSKDDRTVVVDEPVQWDRKADGSLKASWTRHVQKDEVQREDVFKSNYLPPALFKKEEKFVVATPSVNNLLPPSSTEVIPPVQTDN